jgi:hypothetical protein
MALHSPSGTSDPATTHSSYERRSSKASWVSFHEVRLPSSALSTRSAIRGIRGRLDGNVTDGRDGLMGRLPRKGDLAGQPDALPRPPLPDSRRIGCRIWMASTEHPIVRRDRLTVDIPDWVRRSPHRQFGRASVRASVQAIPKDSPDGRGLAPALTRGARGNSPPIVSPHHPPKRAARAADGPTLTAGGILGYGPPRSPRWNGRLSSPVSTRSFLLGEFPEVRFRRTSLPSTGLGGTQHAGNDVSNMAFPTRPVRHQTSKLAGW